MKRVDKKPAAEPDTARVRMWSPWESPSGDSIANVR